VFRTVLPVRPSARIVPTSAGTSRRCTSVSFQAASRGSTYFFSAVL